MAGNQGSQNSKMAKAPRTLRIMSILLTVNALLTLAFVGLDLYIWRPNAPGNEQQMPITNFTKKIGHLEETLKMRENQNALSADLYANITQQQAENDGMKQLINKMEKQIENVSLLLKNIQQNALPPNIANKTKQLFSIEQPKNRWNPGDCHNDIVINPMRNSIQYKGVDDKIFVRSCRAETMLRRHFGLFYFEVEIMHMTSFISIGLSPKQMPLTVRVGFYEGTYSYNNDGTFVGHTVEGHTKVANNGVVHPIVIEEENVFAVGDVLGCGVNLATRQIIYTKNGQRLKTTNLFVDTIHLFPTVSLVQPFDMVEANFGPIFRYNLSNYEN